MTYRYPTILTVLLLGALVFSGCGSAGAGEAQASHDEIMAESVQEESIKDGQDAADKTDEADENEASLEDYFSVKDLSDDVELTEAVRITLSGSTITADSDDVTITDSTVTITKEGTYSLSGSLENGSIIVDAGKEDKIRLVLNGVSISSDSFAAVYVKQADKVFVTLAEGTENVLTNGGTFTQIDDNNVDAVVFSKDDMTLNGTGSLNGSTGPILPMNIRDITGWGLPSPRRSRTPIIRKFPCPVRIIGSHLRLYSPQNKHCPY